MNRNDERKYDVCVCVESGENANRVVTVAAMWCQHAIRAKSSRGAQASWRTLSASARRWDGLNAERAETERAGVHPIKQSLGPVSAGESHT